MMPSRDQAEDVGRVQRQAIGAASEAKPIRRLGNRRLSEPPMMVHRNLQRMRSRSSRGSFGRRKGSRSAEPTITGGVRKNSCAQVAGDPGICRGNKLAAWVRTAARTTNETAVPAERPQRDDE